MTTETTSPPVKKRKSHKKLIALGIFLLIVGGLGGAAYAFRRTLASPSVGSVVSTLPASANQRKIELAQYDGTTFSFVHPMTYIEQTSKQPPIANELESHTFVSSGIISKLLTIIVSKLPSGKLEDDASYYMRTQNSAKYKMKTSVIKNEKVVIFTTSDTQQYQQTAFWAHGGKLLTFTMTGVASDVPAMTVEYNDMVNSITWR
jgi:hypothetical protein